MEQSFQVKILRKLFCMIFVEYHTWCFYGSQYNMGQYGAHTSKKIKIQGMQFGKAADIYTAKKIK